MSVTAVAATSPRRPRSPAPAMPGSSVAALSLTNMMSYVERQILTLLFTPIKHDFRLNDTQVSLLAGAAFVLFYVAFGLVIGRLADRSNRKRIIMVGVVFWSLATTACGLAQNFLQLFLARISVGIGEASLSPSALSIISDYFPRERLTRAISFYTGAQYVGAGLALVVGGLAIKFVSLLPPIQMPGLGVLRPWQMTFMMVGLGGLLFAIPMLFVREPVRRGVAAARSATRQGAPAVPAHRLLLAANRRMLGCHFAGFSISSMLGFGVAAWVPTYFIRVHHWAAQDIGYVYGGVMAVMGLAGALTGARLAEWLERRGVADVFFAMPMVTASLNMVLFPAAMFAPSATPSRWPSSMVSTFIGTLPLSLIMAVAAGDRAEPAARSAGGALHVRREHPRCSLRPHGDRPADRLCLSRRARGGPVAR